MMICEQVRAGMRNVNTRQMVYTASISRKSINTRDCTIKCSSHGSEKAV